MIQNTSRLEEFYMGVLGEEVYSNVGNLSIQIHFLIILLVISGSNMVHPGFIIHVPINRFCYAFFKLN
jgi:hypothetical protein